MGAVMLYLIVTCVFSVTIVTAQVSDGCKNPLGMKDGGIQDSQLTSSSVYTSRIGNNYDATEGRLDGQSCWGAEEANLEQWIRVDFDTPKYVAGILLQGCPYSYHSTWVTAYKVQYGIDDSSNWQYVKDENQNDMIFQGNSDRNTQVTSLFTSEVWVTRVRIRPTEWNPGMPGEYTFIGMRFEILGCEEDVILTTETHRSIPYIVTSSKVPHILTSTIASTASQKETTGFMTTNMVLAISVSLSVVALILISVAVLLLCFKSRIGKSDVNTAPAENPDSNYTGLNPATMTSSTYETYGGEVNMGMVDSTNNTPQSILASPSDNQDLTYAYADADPTTFNLPDDTYLSTDGDTTGKVTSSPRNNNITSPKEDLGHTYADVDLPALGMTYSTYLTHDGDVSKNDSNTPRSNVPMPPPVQLSTRGGDVATGYYVNTKSMNKSN